MTTTTDNTTYLITPKSWNPPKHTFLPPKTTQGGSKSITCLYKEHQWNLKLPKMSIAFDTKDFKDNKQFIMTVKLNDSTDCRTLQSKLEQFDELMISEAAEYSVDWLNGSKSKPMSKAIVETRYKSPVKQSDQYGPSIVIKLPKPKEGVFDIDIIDFKGKPIKLTENNIKTVLAKHVPVEVTVSPYVWSNTNFGISLYAQKIVVYPIEKIEKVERLIIDDPTDD